MTYIYGNFTNEQVKENAEHMHSQVHKLLLYKDKNIEQKIFDNDEDFLSYYRCLLYRFGGLNELLSCPVQMVDLMSTLQTAYDMITSKDFNFCEYRKLILNAHALIKAMFEESEEKYAITKDCP